MTQERNSILIVGRSPEFSDRVSGAFKASFGKSLTKETSSFAGMNGHASEIVRRHDVVIFESDPDDPAELDAVSAMTGNRHDRAFFVALTDENLSIAKARRLYDVGVDEVLPETIDDERLSDVIGARLEQRRREAQDGAAARHGEVICVAQARGGVGSTTVAVNLALSLTGKGGGFLKRKATAKVALIDLDVQFGNAGVLLDLEDNGGFSRLIESVDPPDAQFVSAIMMHHDSGIDVLSAPLTVAPLHAVTSGQMAALFDVLRREYDYVVVDLPHALVEWLEPVIERAGRLLIVTDTSVPCVRQARRLMDFYKESNLGLAVDFVVNRESRPMIRSETQKEAETVLETRFQHWIPDNPKVARKAIDLGHPVVEGHAGSDIGKALRKLAAGLQETAPAATPAAAAPPARFKIA